MCAKAHSTEIARTCSIAEFRHDRCAHHDTAAEPVRGAAPRKALLRYDILDTPPEPAFTRIADLVRLIFGVETSIVSLMDAHRQWYKAANGTPRSENARDIAFCDNVVMTGAALVVPDATKDNRFRNNPLVTAEAGRAILRRRAAETEDGHNIGTICAVDSIRANLPIANWRF